MCVEGRPPRGLSERLDGSLLPLAGFLLVAVCGLAVRGSWPVDETRYSAVAWAMWQRGDFLVPYLLGEPYSHKPPLLFWLLHVGWFVGGVGESWPRLLPWLLGLGQLLALRRLARIACPDSPRLAGRAVWLQVGLTPWLAWAGMLVFDVLLAACVLMALGPCVRALRERRPLEWIPVGVWLGLAILAKGPVALVYVLPAMVALPVVRGYPAGRHGSRVADAATDVWRPLAAVALALAIAAAWAVPAALAGGEAYAEAILWGQVAGRMVDSFAHRQPPWWYLPWLPLLLFPWSLRPDLFGGAAVDASPQRLAVRRWLLWAVGMAFLLLCAISGKQLHYLVPLLPLAVLWLALRLPVRDGRQPGGRCVAGLPAIAPILLAIGLAAVAAGLLRPGHWPSWVASLDFQLPLALLVVATVGWRLSRSTPVPPIVGPSVIGLGTFLALQLGLVRLADTDFRMQPIATHLAQAEASGAGWAYLGGYAGEFDLAGRLGKPPALPADAAALLSWARSSAADALVLEMFRGELPAGIPTPLLQQPWRGGQLAVWRAGDVAGNAALREFLGP